MSEDGLVYYANLKIDCFGDRFFLVHMDFFFNSAEALMQHCFSMRLRLNSFCCKGMQMIDANTSAYALSVFEIDHWRNIGIVARL